MIIYIIYAFDAPNSILEDQKFGIFLGILPDPLYATLCT